ncbi:MAG: hydroxymethylbilane synthase [Prosthecobacter sp.]|jgi:hydroxymethylbilane synthase|uniref:hydroxymethylbilane synthase n=1 Tax=Prosthecobacter sp. TaxID=1965333 RepID=UPI0019E85C02|nr:hydroxymethylbilane synthase [Prosthecobacter sp.]MBE2284799.1 hydroxymethylbilane synthase [Prosthecobacter sp.]
MSIEKVILGTRGSELALTQTTMVTAALQNAHPQLHIERQIIQTSGDKRQDLRFSEFSGVANVDKGIFIKELEIALENRQIDAAVHSLKDVPSDLAAGFTIAAVLSRAPIEDVLITRDPHTLDSLPKGARVGTSSVRRAAQLKFLRPDLEIVEIRGNVPTRVKKVLGENALDAVLLAAAGLLRLGLLNANLSRIHIEGQTLCALVLDPVKFLPAAGQGAIAIECRAGDDAVIQAIRSLNHAETESRVTAEREFLKILGAGCQTPVGAHTWVKDSRLHMAVRVFNEANLAAPPVEREASRPVEEAKQLAADLVAML